MSRFIAAFLFALFLHGQAFAQFFNEGPPKVQATLIAEKSMLTPGEPFRVGVRMKIEPEWHIYWMNPGDIGSPPEIRWTLPEGWEVGPIQWPMPQVFSMQGMDKSYGYGDEVVLFVQITPPKILPDGGLVTLKAVADWVVCRQECIPESADMTLTFPVAQTHEALFEKFSARLPKAGEPPYAVEWRMEGLETLLKVSGLPVGAKTAFFPITPVNGVPSEVTPGEFRLPERFADNREGPLRGLLVVGDEGWYVQSPDAKEMGATAAALGGGGGDGMSLGLALGMGLIGGFILNLMPCVLPVIALKIFGFLGQAGQERSKVLRVGLAFVGGIYAWFIGLAALVVIARSFGKEVTWAFQFQEPGFVLGMIVLIFVFSLNMLGVFEIWLPGGERIAALSGKDGYGGAFLHGMFATLMATPCTAPFLGPALAFAFSQSPVVTFAMFASVATGMGLPYLLLSWRPGWMSFLPKPGVWMERLKQFMGFLLVGTVVWLLGVYGAHTDLKTMIGLCWILLGIGLACWVFGAWVRPGAGAKQLVLSFVAMAVFVGLGLFLAKPAVGGWEPWSLDRVAALRKEGKPFLVDFTAEWCANCKWNERMVLDTDAVRSELAGFTLLKADWTKRDAVIAAELRKHGRVGVPVYLVYPAGGGEPEVLPELLTKEIVLDAAARARKP